MPKCDLWIELDEPDRLYATGQRVTGRVLVRASESVKCKGLKIATEWRTHGRGNVAKGEGDETVVFEGQLEPGREYAFDFDLAVAIGPSTYHGHYLNIDHFVKAQIDIPWAFDPKSEVPFQVRANASVEEIAEIHGPKQLQGTLAWVIGSFFVVVFGAMLLAFWFVLIPIALVAGGWWYFYKHLPAKAVGEVTCRLSRSTFAPGAQVAGELAMTPPRDLSIDGITWTVAATEKCASGSGTNQTTHTHVAHSTANQIAGAGVLPAGQESRFVFGSELPLEPIYSVKLDDNQLIWHGELRVAISRYPDWVKKIEFMVCPTSEATADFPWLAKSEERADREEPSGLATRLDDLPFVEPALVAAPVVAPAAEPVKPAVTFSETARLVYATRDTPEDIDRIITAVSDVPLEMTARVQRREFFGGEDTRGYDGGYSFRAIALDPPLPMTLYVRRDEVDEFEQLGGGVWRGTGRIVGYCDQRNRLLVRVE